VNILGVNNDRPYIAEDDSSSDATTGSPAPDSAGDDSTTTGDSPDERDGSDEFASSDAGGSDLDGTLDAGPLPDASLETGDDAGYATFDGAVPPGPSCVSPDGSVPRTAFNASQYLVGPGPGFAAPKSGCGNTVRFNTASPARIEAENFDVGGEGISYYDTTPRNYYGQYRGEDVDVEWGVCMIPCADVDYVAPNEWLEYTIDVSKTWAYSLTVEYAARGNEAFHVDLDGQRLVAMGFVPLPATIYDPSQAFNYLSFKTMPTYLTACIPAGRHVLRVTFDGPDNNALALDYIEFGPTASCGGSGVDAGPTDAGPTDAGPTDAGPTDAGPTDAGGQ
jgi:hypothetical protein